jgi:hypothetical protein
MRIGYNNINCVGSGTIYGLTGLTIVLLLIGLICGLLLGYILFHKEEIGEEKGK